MSTLAAGGRRAGAWRDPARLGWLAFALVAAGFFLLPLYVMAVTSLKGMEEIRAGQVFSLPAQPVLLDPIIRSNSITKTIRIC